MSFNVKVNLFSVLNLCVCCEPLNLVRLGCFVILNAT